MARPSKIRHARIILPEEKTQELVLALHEAGVCELKKADAPQDISDKFVHEELKELDDAQNRLRALLSILDLYKEENQVDSTLKRLFSPSPAKKHRVEIRKSDAILSEVSAKLETLEKSILPKSSAINDIDEKLRGNKYLAENLSFLPDVETRVFEPTSNIKSMLGIMSKSDFEDIRKELEKKTVFAVKEKGKELVLVSVFPLNEDAPNTERILHEKGFETIRVPFENRKPKDILRELAESSNEMHRKRREAEEVLRQMWKKHAEELKITEEEIIICKDRFEALKCIKATTAFSIMETWVPESKFKRFNLLVQETTPYYYMETEERDDAPTMLNNKAWAKPFESVLRMYGLPKYKHFDPTIILAVSFPAFFGFMLTDFAYGFLLLFFALFLYFRAGKYDPSIKDLGTVFIFFGAYSVAFGLLFGSYFGDFWQRIGLNLPMPIDPMKDVMLGIGLAVATGLLHLTVGLTVGFVENMKKGKYRLGLMDQGVWLVFIISVLCFILPLNLSFMKSLGVVLLFVSVGMQLFLNFLEKGFVPALLSIFGYSGFLGDTFSYARLMALGIGTSGIALAVNFMVLLAADMIPYAGVPIAIIIFIIGHAFNMIMNGLGGFVHSLRLHFLEFFSKFYDGGGREYKPFHALRKITYTEVKKWQ